MTKDNRGFHIANDGHQPLNKGHQPIAVAPARNDQAGHQPTGSGDSSPRTPPSQGSSGTKN